METIRRPFSYRVPYSYFTRKTEVWDATGKPVVTIADLPVSDDVPRQGVPTGPRSITWQPLHDARLIWTEALDGGDPKKKVAHRDKVMSLEAPFTAKPSLVMEVQHRFSGFPGCRRKTSPSPPSSIATAAGAPPHSSTSRNPPNRARSCST